MASLLPASGLLGFANAKHLLRRTTYHITKQRIDDFAGMTASDAVDSLFVDLPFTIDEPIDYITGQPFVNSGTESLLSGTSDKQHMIKAWWLHEAYSDTSIKHKLIFFLHQYFAVNTKNTVEGRDSFDYLSLLHLYAFGSYKELARKMTLNNAMLEYLDGASNTVSNPNENYAREFMELFTIGKGEQIGEGNYTNYTEDDVTAASKLLSGWQMTERPIGADPNYIDVETGLQAGIPDYNSHDTSDKVFSSAFGGITILGAVNESDMHRELDDYVNMIFDQAETAKSICRRLYRYFVSADIPIGIENDIIIPLANTMRDNDYNLKTTLKQLLKSQHFYDADNNTVEDQRIGVLVKNPMELLFPVLSFFQISIPDAVTNTQAHYEEWYKKSVSDTIFVQSGLPVLVPESVAGYPAYYQEPHYDGLWLSASSIIARYSIPDMLIKGERVISSGDLGGNIQIDLVDFIENSGIISDPSSAEAIVGELSDYLLAYPLSTERYGYFLYEVFLEGAPAFDWTLDWVDYQNNGNAAAVKIPLENFFKALLYSQEYQLM